jgi:hypothetical protein
MLGSEMLAAGLGHFPVWHLSWAPTLPPGSCSFLTPAHLRLTRLRRRRALGTASPLARSRVSSVQIFSILAAEESSDGISPPGLGWAIDPPVVAGDPEA